MQDIHPTKLLLAVIGAPLSVGVGWLCGAVAKYGIHLDPSGVNALATTGVVAGAGVVVKLIHDVEAKAGVTPEQIAKIEQAALRGAVRADPSLAAGWPPDPPTGGAMSAATAAAVGAAAARIPARRPPVPDVPRPADEGAPWSPTA